MERHGCMKQYDIAQGEVGFAIHRTYAVNMIFPLMRKAVRAVS